jgi:pimeloyl-ACP methyl ester carboxylesterase
MRESGSPTIVLVHGAFVDGAGWRFVHDLLVGQGHAVEIVQNPCASLAGDVAATRWTIDRLPGRVLLVGHSYGGAVITEAGTHARVSGLVYVSAFAPDRNESVETLMQQFPVAATSMALLPAREGLIIQDPEKFHETFGSDLPDVVAGFMAHAQVPWGVDAVATRVSNPAWRSRPSWYLIASRDRAIPPEAQRNMAQRAGSQTTECAATHAVYMTCPDHVAAFIAQAAEEAAWPAP